MRDDGPIDDFLADRYDSFKETVTAAEETISILEGAFAQYRNMVNTFQDVEPMESTYDGRVSRAQLHEETERIAYQWAEAWRTWEQVEEHVSVIQTARLIDSVRESQGYGRVADEALPERLENVEQRYREMDIHLLEMSYEEDIPANPWEKRIEIDDAYPQHIQTVDSWKNTLD